MLPPLISKADAPLGQSLQVGFVLPFFRPCSRSFLPGRGVPLLLFDVLLCIPSIAQFKVCLTQNAPFFSISCCQLGTSLFPPPPRDRRAPSPFSLPFSPYVFPVILTLPPSRFPAPLSSAADRRTVFVSGTLICNCFFLCRSLAFLSADRFRVRSLCLLPRFDVPFVCIVILRYLPKVRVLPGTALFGSSY